MSTRARQVHSTPVVVAVLLVASLVGGGLAWYGTSAWSSRAYVASAEVSIAPLIGTYSSFEVATHVADFSAAYDGGGTSGDGGSDPDAPGAYVDSSRIEDATLVEVTFVADSEEAAIEGLRDGVGEALVTIGDGLALQADFELRAARAAYQAQLDAANERGLGFRDPAVARTGEIVADSAVAVRTLRIARQSTRERVADLEVTTEPVANTRQRLRATGVAALIGFGVAGGVLLLTRRSTDEHPGRAPARSGDEVGPDPS